MPLMRPIRSTIAMALSSALLSASICGATPGAIRAPPPAAAIQPPRDILVLDLPGIRRLFDALVRQRTSGNEGERVGAWVDLSLLVGAVLRESRTGPLVFDDPERPRPDQPAPRVVVTQAMAARDDAAYQLLSLGYSSRETADVVAGRVSRQALDTAQKMLMVGQGRDAVADFLDREYRTAGLRNRPGPLSVSPGGEAPNRFDAAIEKYARMHGVGAPLVRAIISVESAFDPAARSPAGAIGLMQLMPATARALGVDPTAPEQNIEGGVRYLSELLQIFGGTELALVAYNGGPGFARRYARGQAGLYGETRDYVRRVMALAPAPALTARAVVAGAGTPSCPCVVHDRVFQVPALHADFAHEVWLSR